VLGNRTDNIPIPPRSLLVGLSHQAPFDTFRSVPQCLLMSRRVTSSSRSPSCSACSALLSRQTVQVGSSPSVRLFSLSLSLSTSRLFSNRSNSESRSIDYMIKFELYVDPMSTDLTKSRRSHHVLSSRSFLGSFAIPIQINQYFQYFQILLKQSLSLSRFLSHLSLRSPLSSTSQMKSI
jgi:hypothetical protein